MQRLHALYPSSQPVHVHIANLAAQTGASLFLHANSLPHHPAIATSVTPMWVYNKTEGLHIDQLMASTSPFTHLIVETLPNELPPQWRVVEAIRIFNGFKGYVDIRSVVQAVRGLDHVALVGHLRHLAKLPTRDALWILERT